MEIRERFEERAAIAEFDGGLSRTEAELLAWDEVRTCVQCHRDTEGEEDDPEVEKEKAEDKEEFDKNAEKEKKKKHFTPVYSSR